MLNGIDISNWQSMSELETEIEGDCSFVIIKVSEGGLYQDKKARGFAIKCAEHGIPIFFYHFCKFDYGVEKEEEHFMECVNEVLGRLPMGTRVGLALDFECHKHLIPRLAEMVNHLNKKYGVCPLIYCSEWLVPHIGAMVDTNKFGLWVAKYSNNKPNINPWEVMAFWQYTDSPIDRNRFYGTKEQLVKYQDYSISSRCPYCKAEKCVKERWV